VSHRDGKKERDKKKERGRHVKASVSLKSKGTLIKSKIKACLRNEAC